jgi:hypothetical protein
VRSLVLLRGGASTVCDAVLACLGESVAALGADGLTSSLVFVVGCDVADRGMQPDCVVFKPCAFELGFEFAGMADLLQVRPLALDVPEQGLDTGWATRRGARVRVLFRVASLRTGLASFPAPGSPVIMSWS